MITVVHVITGLGVGGAETMLLKLLGNMDSERFSSRVVSLMGDGPLSGRIRSLGVPVHALNMSRDGINAAAFLELAGLLRRWRPDVVQTWMYHADLAGGIAARIAGLPKVVWNIRHGDTFSHLNRRRTRYILKVCALLSHWIPSRIICCSNEVLAAHSIIGYSLSRLVAIPNGFDCETFRPDAAARASFRNECGIPADAEAIGMAGRFHPHKDHLTFLRAAKKIQLRRPDTHFVLCGLNIDSNNSELNESVSSDGPEYNLHLLGLRVDMPRVFAALDIVVSSSVHEGFPNVLGEAMLCGVPCVTTDAGASSELVANTGRIVPPGHPEALAGQCISLLEAGQPMRLALGQRAREQIISRFGITEIARRYERIYEEVLRCAA